jgi:hypothetical protein
MADNLKQCVDLGNGWTVALVEDQPYDDLIRVISPWGDCINLVKNEETGGQSLLWRYFATVVNTRPQQPAFSIPGYPWKYQTQTIPGIGQVTLTTIQEVTE